MLCGLVQGVIPVLNIFRSTLLHSRQCGMLLNSWYRMPEV